MITGLWHLVLNWKPMMSYMTKKAKEHAGMPIPLLSALAITLFVYAGTLLGLPPMAQIMKWNEDVKSYHATTYGDPPYGHAELSSMEKFCAVVQVDVATALAYLKEQKIKGNLTNSTILLDIAKENGMTPQEVYLLIRKSASAGDPFGALPESPPEGTGKRALGDFCKQFGFSFEEVASRLAAKGITAQADDTFTSLATKSNMTAKEIYLIIRGKEGQ
ncbi:conserved exported hypothetical protein [uncultured delta proteobacterium]|uniref:DUF4405 domain-containing protein n=1 Tax=uncultured delta proteobacterium TaxID=34034 RepID=A0A212K851_9DELT|nr:conserved exported hypothetical protein [uncultured delta proteobacterium]